MFVQLSLLESRPVTRSFRITRSTGLRPLDPSDSDEMKAASGFGDEIPTSHVMNSKQDKVSIERRMKLTFLRGTSNNSMLFIHLRKVGD